VGKIARRIVARPHPEEARSAVSKDEDGVALMLRDVACVRAAPQHEGERGLRILAKRTQPQFWRNEPNRVACVFGPTQGPTCGCTKWTSAQFPCFGPVLYREPCNSHVLPALSPAKLASRRCGRMAPMRQPPSWFRLALGVEAPMAARRESNFVSSPRGTPRDARVAGTPLRGPMNTELSMGLGLWVPALALRARPGRRCDVRPR
jgi:hypothetical protein